MDELTAPGPAKVLMTHTPRLRIVLASLLIAALAEACSRPGAGAGAKASLAQDHGRLPGAALDQAIGQGIGDPSTCVLIADKASGKVLYQYGEIFNCVRGLPACDRPGVMSARQALGLAGVAGGRGASCASNADGSRTVGWAEGAVGSKSPDLVYSAVMEGQKALPGHEMASRLSDAFQGAGL
jgi:hypothetical protein